MSDILDKLKSAAVKQHLLPEQIAQLDSDSCVIVRIELLEDVISNIKGLRRLCGVVSNMEEDFRAITKDIKRSSVEPESPKVNG